MDPAFEVLGAHNLAEFVGRDECPMPNENGTDTPVMSEIRAWLLHFQYSSLETVVRCSLLA